MDHFCQGGLGFRRIRPLRTGAGNQLMQHQISRPRTVSSNFDTNCFERHPRPEASIRVRRARTPISSLTKLAADIDNENSSLHRCVPAAEDAALSPAAETMPHAALRFRLRSGAGRPALYYLKHDEAEQHLPGRFRSSRRFFAICCIPIGRH